jgi:hypothetical protein
MCDEFACVSMENRWKVASLPPAEPEALTQWCARQSKAPPGKTADQREIDGNGM